MKPLEIVARSHGTLINLEWFDRENVRPRVETNANHPPREFAIVSTYLRSLAHIRTLIELKSANQFQAIAMLARAVFELAVDLRLIDRVENGPEKHAAFSSVERLRVARRIVEFHRTRKVEEPLGHLWVYEKLINENAASVEATAKKLWPGNAQPQHWSAMRLPKRTVVVGAPFDEIYDIHYAELSWYTHPGVGAVATLDADIYPLVCGQAYGIAARCYRQILLSMINELRLRDGDPLIEKKLEFARMVAFCDDAQVNQLRAALLGS